MQDKVAEIERRKFQEFFDGTDVFINKITRLRSQCERLTDNITQSSQSTQSSRYSTDTQHALVTKLLVLNNHLDNISQEIEEIDEAITTQRMVVDSKTESEIKDIEYRREMWKEFLPFITLYQYVNPPSE